MAHISIKGLAAGVALAAIVTAAPAANVTYGNGRFGTSITYPAHVFNRVAQSPDNGDGQTWLSDDGASLAVYGMINELDASPRELADRASVPGDRKDYTVTYRRVADSWFVLSGFEGDKVFYHRFEMGADGVIHAMLLKYPRSLKHRYDELVAPLARTLRGP